MAVALDEWLMVRCRGCGAVLFQTHLSERGRVRIACRKCRQMWVYHGATGELQREHVDTSDKQS